MVGRWGLSSALASPCGFSRWILALALLFSGWGIPHDQALMTCQRARAQGSRRGGFSDPPSRGAVVPRLGDGHPDPSTCSLPPTHRTHTAAASVTLKHTSHTLHACDCSRSPHVCSHTRCTHAHTREPLTTNTCTRGHTPGDAPGLPDTQATLSHILIYPLVTNWPWT